MNVDGFRAREGEAPAEPRTREKRGVEQGFAWRRLGASLALPGVGEG